jgi:hypothetical protein
MKMPISPSVRLKTPVCIASSPHTGLSACMEDDPITLLCYPATGSSIHCD